MIDRLLIEVAQMCGLVANDVVLFSSSKFRLKGELIGVEFKFRIV